MLEIIQLMETIYLKINVSDHEYFTRRGRDVILNIELDIFQAILGDN